MLLKVIQVIEIFWNFSKNENDVDIDIFIIIQHTKSHIKENERINF